MSLGKHSLSWHPDAECEHLPSVLSLGIGEIHHKDFLAGCGITGKPDSGTRFLTGISKTIAGVNRSAPRRRNAVFAAIDIWHGHSSKNQIPAYDGTQVAPWPSEITTRSFLYQGFETRNQFLYLRNIKTAVVNFTFFFETAPLCRSRLCVRMGRAPPRVISGHP